jgi:hypothetical protein
MDPVNLFIYAIMIKRLTMKDVIKTMAGSSVVMTSTRAMIAASGKINVISLITGDDINLSFPFNQSLRLFISFSWRGLSRPYAINCCRQSSFLQLQQLPDVH